VTTISACLVVYHEQDRLLACLESFADVVDEIIVVHDGPCHDASLSIARRFTEKVVESEKRTESAEFHRPGALSKCTKEWVLVIDADERLTPALRDVLRSLVDTSEIDAYGFDWPYVDENGVRVAPRSMSSKRFLFRRSKMYTIGMPHLTPESYGLSSSAPFAVNHLIGHPFGIQTFRNMMRKNVRRGKAAALKLTEGIDAIEFFNGTKNDSRIKNLRKIRLLARFPVVALLVIPIWSFAYWYLAKGYFRSGWIGLHDALNLPTYYACFAYNMIVLRQSGRTSASH
jgi:glycosyltransferase involved in cell wall biosynthesis